MNKHIYLVEDVAVFLSKNWGSERRWLVSCPLFCHVNEYYRARFQPVSPNSSSFVGTYRLGAKTQRLHKRGCDARTGIQVQAKASHVTTQKTPLLHI